MAVLCVFDLQAELQELDSQILLTQGQGSSGGTMMMMNMNTPPAPMSPPIYHTQSSVSNSGAGGGGSVGGGSGGGPFHSALNSQPSSLGSSNGYGKDKNSIIIIMEQHLVVYDKKLCEIEPK